ncbi:MAG: deoxynucleoside kinase [Gammaproteobacteria bacterium]|nr:deoxynucleoside kinase [Gammaproteobacteria bacterium]
MNSPAITGSTSLRYIAVEGPIGVGKTTLAQRLAESLGSDLMLEAPMQNPFLEKFYANPSQAALSTQLYFLLQRTQQLQTLQQNDMFRPVCIADYLMEKDRLFAEVTLDHHELALYEQLYQHLTIDVPTPDLVIYLQAPVPVLHERILKRGIAAERNISKEYLHRLVVAYTDFFHRFEAATLLIVNAAAVDFARSESDYGQLLEFLSRMRGGRHYFNPLPISSAAGDR